MRLMVETCRECGRSWGVTMAPRVEVLCGDCARPTPSRRPAHYWSLRLIALYQERYWTRSPEWWDQQTSHADLEVAAANAEGWS